MSSLTSSFEKTKILRDSELKHRPMKFKQTVNIVLELFLFYFYMKGQPQNKHFNPLIINTYTEDCNVLAITCLYYIRNLLRKIDREIIMNKKY